MVYSVHKEQGDIGHLLRRAMLSPKIIFHCTDELLSIGTDESLETLVVFLDTIGTGLPFSWESLLAAKRLDTATLRGFKNNTNWSKQGVRWLATV